MKKYIKITNSGTTPRDFLKIIGAGDNKAGNNSVFGEFKSGYKIAGIIALRRGLRMIISSTDDEGRYALEYVVRTKIIKYKGKQELIRKICYKHFDNFKSWIEDSSFALEAFPKWSEAIVDGASGLYAILRELIANARDEDRDFKYETDVASIKMAPSGCTVVYIEQTDDALLILGKHAERYFKFFCSPVYEAPGIGAIYEKSVANETRFFNCGYLIGCWKDNLESRRSSFDYDALGKDFISEEKVLQDKDRSKYDMQIARVILSIRDKNLLSYIIEAAMDVLSYESQIFKYVDKFDELPPDFTALCREIWLEKYGEKAILSCDDKGCDREASSLLGYTVISLFGSLKNLFKKAGVEDARQKMDLFYGGLNERAPNKEEQEKIDRIKAAYLDCHEYYKSLAETYPVTVLIDKSGVAGGMAFDYKRCSIADTVFTKSDSEFLHTWIHELRHCSSKLHDLSYREIMHRADWEIVDLLKNASEENKKKKVLEKENAELKERIRFMNFLLNISKSGSGSEKK